MEEQPGHPAPQQQPGQPSSSSSPPPSSASSTSSSGHPPYHQHHHHHHHHYYYYNHNHHHQQYLGDGGGGREAKAAPLQVLKHEPKHGGGGAGGSGGGGGLQAPQEAPRKKAGYGEINGNVGERDPISRLANGNQTSGEANLTIKPKSGPFGKLGLKSKNFVSKAAMDKKPEKYYESKRELSDKPEGLSIPNGVVTNNAGYITNGYIGKGPDNDGSGSESGYTTPKKRKGRRNSTKGSENLNLVQEKIVSQEPAAVTPALKQEPESLKPESGGSRTDGLKPAWKCEPGFLGAGRSKPGLGEPPRKNSDGKIGPAGKKFEERPKGKPVSSSSASKEDSWTLFKPPPVFPVDNSSAKIVPKISYASKVKENLNKAAQNPSLLSSSSSSSSSSSLCLSSATDVQAQPSTRLSQVPMSAMKSVTSANFANGPVLAVSDRGVPQSLLVPAGGIGVLLTPAELVSQDAAPEQPKSSLFVYPSNMQALLSAQAEPGLFQANQQNLGDIFQNQWGLSFINEPSAGPETGARKPANAKMEEVDSPAALASRRPETPPLGADQPVFPKAYELDKRTSLQLLSGVVKLGTAGEGGGGFLLDSHPPLPPLLPGGPRQGLEHSGPLVFLAKDYHVAESCLASPTNSFLASAKEQRQPRGQERKQGPGDFDLGAAVLYHTQEMESICNLQKQDPKRIITYDEAMDRPNQ